MPTSKTTPRLTRHAPYFPIENVDSAVDFYVTRLGFQREYVAGSPAQFAIVTRDGQAIMFRKVDSGVNVVPNEQQGGTWDVFFWVQNLDALYSEILAAGVDVVYHPLVQEAYAMREFAIRDAFGYVLGFGEPMSSPAGVI